MNGTSFRAFSSSEDAQACVALQNEIWGRDFADHVPASLLQVATHVGGLALGAFGGNGALVGFVFSLAGTRDGETVHWSHMLAVRRDVQSMGIGRHLKELQRSELARRGVSHVYWTFDPLQSRNAHLNLNRLGVRVIDYVANMYGVTESPLHYGLATDRLIVVCPTTVPAAPLAAPVDEKGPVLTPFPQDGDALADRDGTPAPIVLLEIPFDLEQVAARSTADAATWRMATREHFRWALERGYEVTRLRRDPVTLRSFYALAQPRRAPTA